VLAQLTIAHAEMLDRHGPLMGMDSVKRPTPAVEFAGEQARLAAIQDTESDVTRRVALMMEREARTHEQIGRLASFIAGYELTHGDPSDAGSMQQLGGDHFDIAAKIRTTLKEPGMSDTPSEQEPPASTLEALRNELRRESDYWAGKSLDALHEHIVGQQEVVAANGGYVTLDRISGSKWNAVFGKLPSDASPELRAAVQTAAGACVEEAYNAMQRARSGEPFYVGAETEPGPDAHEYFEEFHLDALKRLEDVGGRSHSADASADLTDPNIFERVRAERANQNDRDPDRTL
jgi:hypothetical protein